LINIVRNGIPGTPMPPSSLPETQAAAVVAFIRSMAGSAAAFRTAPIPGDAERGKAIFEGKGECRNCHRVNRNGSFLGPDLSVIGSARRRVDLERALLDPNADIRPYNHMVRVVNRDGTTVMGRLLNQDTYSLQMLDPNGKLLSVSKASLREFEIMKTSGMPSYKDKFTDQELADVITYLVTLKGGSQ
jgi:putative heme-binding domain-containing protein